MSKEKEVKDLLYRLEDIIALGVSLPLVAFTQLKPHINKMMAYIEENEDRGLVFHTNEVELFILKHQGDYEERDERALSRGFLRMKKAHPDRLDEWRKWDGIFKSLKRERVV